MSSTMGAFEILPFRSIGGGQAEEIRRGGGAAMRMGAGKRYPSGATGSKRMMRHGPWPPQHGPYRRFGGYAPAWGASTSVADNTQAAAGYPTPSEQVRWVQFALNQVMNANLPTDGIASPEFRATLRDFQMRQGLPVSGFVGPDTIAALQSRGGEAVGREIGGRNTAYPAHGLDEFALATELLEAQTEAELGAVLQRIAAQAQRAGQTVAAQARRAAQTIGDTAASVRRDPLDAAGRAAGAMARSYYLRHTGDLFGAQQLGEGVHRAVSQGPTTIISQGRALLDRFRDEHKEIRELYEIAPDLALQRAVGVVRQAAGASVVR
jgi:hypothetical protein